MKNYFNAYCSKNNLQKLIKRICVLVTVFTLMLTNQANAGLIDRGNGMIYDDYLDITWLADANYAETSGYANTNAMGDVYSSPSNIQADGKMGWEAAMTWAEQLVYEGYNDWRLMDFPNGVYKPCMFYDCTDSELGHLFYIDMGLSSGDKMSSKTLGLFSNIQDGYYWSGSSFFSTSAYVFNVSGGRQNADRKYASFYGWAVRDGDIVDTQVNDVPEPATFAIFGLGLLGLMVRRKTF